MDWFGFYDGLLDVFSDNILNEIFKWHWPSTTCEFLDYFQVSCDKIMSSFNNSTKITYLIVIEQIHQQEPKLTSWLKCWIRNAGVLWKALFQKAQNTSKYKVVNVLYMSCSCWRKSFRDVLCRVVHQESETNQESLRAQFFDQWSCGYISKIAIHANYTVSRSTPDYLWYLNLWKKSGEELLIMERIESSCVICQAIQLLLY